MYISILICHCAEMDSTWLKTQFRLNPETNKAGLAAALGIGAPAVSKMLAGTRQIKASEYVQMRRFFGLPVDGDSAARSGKSESRYVLESMAMREKDEPEAQQDSWVIPASLLKGRTAAPPDKVRVFKVQESAMAPDFMPGEHVLVDLADQSPSPPGAFLVSDGIGQIVRRCEHVPHSQPPQVRLSTASGKFEARTVSLKDAGILGRIIAKLSWL